MSQKSNLMGIRCGRLVVIAPAENSRSGKARWVCQCDCGKQVTVAAGSLKSKRQMSCRCLQKENLRRALFLPNGEGAVGDLYRSYSFKARHRKLPFELTREAFRKLILSNCVYCGFPPSRTKTTKSGSTIIYNGIDRADNSKGYVAGNAEPCCTECNFAKGRRNKDEFSAWLSRFRVFVREA